jgi:hypothetical protein
MGHNMAPVTGGVTNREEYRFVFFLSYGESIFIPGMPIDRIKGMLQEIGALFFNEDVCFLTGGQPFLYLIMDAVFVFSHDHPPNICNPEMSRNMYLEEIIFLKKKRKVNL